MRGLRALAFFLLAQLGRQIGQRFKVVGADLPPPAGLQSPALWGTEPHIVELLGAHAADIRAERGNFNFGHPPAAHWLQIFCDYDGPTHNAFAALDAPGQKALAADIAGLLERLNVGGRISRVVPAQ